MTIVLAAIPLLYVLTGSVDAGASRLAALLFRPYIGRLLIHTAELVVSVTAASVALGIGAAWLVERADLPLRGLWRALLPLPLAIPAFVSSFAWVSIGPAFEGMGGAIFILALAEYPLIYLPASAALRGMDPALDEVAQPFVGRTLGRNRINLLLRRLTEAFIAQGYITTRAYLGQQNLSSGTLTIDVVKGRIAAFTLNGQPLRPRSTQPGRVPPVGGGFLSDDGTAWAFGASQGDALRLGLVGHVNTSLGKITNDAFDFLTFTSYPSPNRSRIATLQYDGRASATLDRWGLTQTLGLAYNSSVISNADPDNGYSLVAGNRVKLDWQGHREIADGQTLLLGAETARDAIHRPVSYGITTNAGFAELNSDFGNGLYNSASLRFDAQTAGPVAIAVYTDTGDKLTEALVDAQPGSNAWSWNGRDSNGNQIADGSYRVAMMGATGGGAAQALPFTVEGTATGVVRDGGGLTLQMGALAVDFSAVKQVLD